MEAEACCRAAEVFQPEEGIVAEADDGGLYAAEALKSEAGTGTKRRRESLPAGPSD